MKVVENQWTQGVKIMIPIEHGKILIGHQDGMISMWQYDRYRNDLQHCRNYSCYDEQAIIHLSNMLETNFISINKKFNVRLWDKELSTSSSFNVSEVIKHLCSAILLPNTLIAIAGSEDSSDSEDLTFSIWDVDQKFDFGKCIFRDQNRLWKPRYVNMAISAQGFLIVCGHCDSDISIWRINRQECTMICEGRGPRVYSMACLPTGEVVTGNHSLHFYRVSEGFVDYLEDKTLYNRNVADSLHPIGGYKLFICHRRMNSNVFQLWDLITKEATFFGWTSPNDERGFEITVLENESAVLCLTDKENKIVIHNFEQEIFRFPKNLAEIRKNSRVLFQAQQMENNSFARLPAEIITKIILLTPDCMTESEKKVSSRMATNYFCYPSVRDE